MEFLKEWIQWAFKWITDTTAELGRFLLDNILAVIPLPASMVGPGQGFDIYFNLVDDYLPLSESIAVFAATITFSVAMIIFRYVLKFIPTIG